MRLLGETKSLLLTGLADVWASRKDTRGRPGDRVGLELMVVSAAMFALMAAVAKKLLPHTPITESMVRKLRALREQRVELEAAESAIEARLKHTIGEAAGIQGPNWRVTWKAPKPTVVTDYKGLVQQLAPASELVAEYTDERANSRRFLVSFPKQET